MGWIKEGKEVQSAGKAPLPLMRQMQILMGILFMVFATLGTFVNPWFSSATILFGAGLFMAGVTGNCAVASTLAKAPWNKADPKLKDEFCRASGNCN
jgi:hypothetical protein